MNREHKKKKKNKGYLIIYKVIPFVEQYANGHHANDNRLQSSSFADVKQ